MICLIRKTTGPWCVLALWALLPSPVFAQIGQTQESMALIHGSMDFCIDRYEASFDANSHAVSVPGSLPAVNISGIQAEAACAAGWRLPPPHPAPGSTTSPLACTTRADRSARASRRSGRGRRPRASSSRCRRSRARPRSVSCVRPRSSSPPARTPMSVRAQWSAAKIPARSYPPAHPFPDDTSGILPRDRAA